MPLLNNDGLDDPLYFETLESFSGGQSSLPRSTSLAANQAEFLQNWTITATGELRKRRGASSLTADGVVTAYGKPVQSLMFYNTVAIDHLIAVASGKAYYFDGNSWELEFNANITDHNERVTMVQLMDNLYWTDSNKLGIRKWNGITVSDVASSPPATILERHGTRLVAAGAATTPDEVAFSDFLDGDNWPTLSRLRVGGGDGDPVIALKSWQKTWVVVLKRHSTHVITADPVIAVGQFAIDAVHASIGCVAKRSVSQVGQDIWFLAPGGVQSIQKQMATSNNQIAEPVSYPIQDVIDLIRWDFAYKSSAIFYNNHYLLAVPILDEDPDTVLAYNTLTGGWTVFTGWEVTMFCEEPFQGRTRLVFGTIFGEVLEWLDYVPEGSEGEDTYKDWCGGVSLDFQIPQQLTMNSYVESVVRSRGMVFSEPLNQKSGFYLESEFRERDGSAEVWVIRDSKDPEKLGEVTFSVSQIMIPFDLPTRFPISGWMRSIFPLQQLSDFRELQVEIRSKTGNCIVRNINISAFLDTLDFLQH